jgi:hypothetical protein
MCARVDERDGCDLVRNGRGCMTVADTHDGAL